MDAEQRRTVREEACKLRLELRDAVAELARSRRRAQELIAESREASRRLQSMRSASDVASTDDG